MNNYNNTPTSSGTREKIQSRSYTEEINQNTDCKLPKQTIKDPYEFQIDKFSHWKGYETRRTDRYLYAIFFEEITCKNLLIDGHLINSEPRIREMISKLKTN
ncbi:MAG TPA: hypothetical protein VKZ98_01020 [Aquaticitalea sp.]|nr:hypothetical protein [Aquaticitalea sp.]